jgi:PPM family protein phosphatase
VALVLRTAARSHVGVVRSRNEDSGFAAPRLIAVADGMGGHAAGELASATAVATLAELDAYSLDPDDVVRAATELIDITSDRIAEAIADDIERSGMGTTLTSILMLKNAVAVVHGGDSRAYLFRDGMLSQITKDHTYVQTLIDAGQISDAEAAIHPRRNLIMRAIDGTPGVMVDVSIREAREGDRLLVCSDGLTGVVSHESIQQSLRLKDITASVTDMVDKALAAGAPDNVTVVVADVVDVDDPTDALASEPVVVGAASEPRNRIELPDVVFPGDVQPDPDGLLPFDDANAVRRGGADLSALTSVYREYRLGRAGRVRSASRGGSGRGSGLMPVILTTAAVVLALVGAGIVMWAKGQWFVTSNDDGIVVINNGIRGEVVGIRLSRTAQTSTIPMANLPAYDRDLLLDTIYADDLQDAQAVIARLACRAVPPAAECVTTGPISPVSPGDDSESDPTQGPTSPGESP